MIVRGQTTISYQRDSSRSPDRVSSGLHCFATLSEELFRPLCGFGRNADGVQEAMRPGADR